jgi:hypothetical protein
MTVNLQVATTGTVSGLANNQQINVIAANLATMSQGTTAPTAASTGLVSIAGLWWHDTTNNVVKLRNQADTAWITIGTVDETSGLFTATPGPIGARTSRNVGAGTYTWVVPAGVSSVLASACAPGAGGGAAIGGGGGAGDEVYKYPLSVVAGHTISIAIGAPGAGAVSSGSGGNGGTLVITDTTSSSVLLSFAAATGGGSTNNAPSTAAGGNPGTGGTGAGAGGNGFLNGTFGTGGAGGGGTFGTGGCAGAGTATGQNGAGFGAGGGGGAGSANGGTGAPGLCILEW